MGPVGDFLECISYQKNGDLTAIVHVYFSRVFFHSPGGIKRPILTNTTQGRTEVHKASQP